MTRTYSTITWGLALLVAAVVLAWAQSLPWSLAAAGAVAVIVGIGKSLTDDDVASDAKKRAVADQVIGAPED